MMSQTQTNRKTWKVYKRRWWSPLPAHFFEASSLMVLHVSSKTIIRTNFGKILDSWETNSCDNDHLLLTCFFSSLMIIYQDNRQSKDWLLLHHHLLTLVSSWTAAAKSTRFCYRLLWLFEEKWEHEGWTAKRSRRRRSEEKGKTQTKKYIRLAKFAKRFLTLFDNCLILLRICASYSDQSSWLSTYVYLVTWRSRGLSFVHWHPCAEINDRIDESLMSRISQACDWQYEAFSMIHPLNLSFVQPISSKSSDQ